MINKLIIKQAILIVADRRIEFVSNDKSNMGLIFDVKTKDLNQVRIYQRKGKIFINCGCKNSIRYGVNNLNICKHKLAAVLLIWKEMLFEKFNPIYRNIFFKAFELVLTESVQFYDNQDMFRINGKEVRLVKGKYSTYLEDNKKEPELTPEKIACLIKIISMTQ